MLINRSLWAVNRALITITHVKSIGSVTVRHLTAQSDFTVNGKNAICKLCNDSLLTKNIAKHVQRKAHVLAVSTQATQALQAPMPDAEAHSSVHVGRAFALENLDPLEVARAQRHQQLLHNSLPTITDRPPPSMLSERRIEITREEEDVRLDAGTLPSPVDEYYEPEREMDIALYMAAASEEFEVDIEGGFAASATID